MSKKLKLKDRFQELDKMPKGLSSEDARRRGLHFETLVLDLFESHGMLLRRSYHTSDGRSEQIDGAIRVDGRLALVESKWVASQLAASELFAFSGKVDGKFTGTIGVFISRNELSENFLTALRTGRRQAVLVIHGQDVDDIFEDGFSLKEYLQSSLEVTSIDNICHYPTSKFIVAQVSAASPVAPDVAQVIPLNVERELKESEFINIADEVANKIRKREVDNVFAAIISKYKEQAKQGKLDQGYAQNLILLAQELKPRLSQQKLEADWLLFDSVSRNFLNSPLRPFVDLFAERLSYLSSEEREMISQRLVKQWNLILGNYDNENEMAEITKPLWNHLNKNAKIEMLSIFVSFVVSSRVPRYPQVRLAEECIKKAKSGDVEEAVKSLLKKNIESWMEDIDPKDFTDKDRSRLIGWQTREYGKLSVNVNQIAEKLVDETLRQLRLR